MSKLVSVASVLSLIAFAGAAAHADVVYDNASGFPGVNLNFHYDYCSSCGGAYQVYQPFAIDAGATIDHVDFAESGLAGAAITITFWNGALDTLLFSRTVAVGAYSMTNTGYNWDIVSANISALALDAGNYYVSFQSSDNMTIAGFDSGLASLVQTYSANDANPSTDLDPYPVDRYGAFLLSSPSAPAPEPASWTLMLGGFGLVGGALRSRRQAAVSFG